LRPVGDRIRSREIGDGTTARCAGVESGSSKSPLGGGEKGGSIGFKADASEARKSQSSLPKVPKGAPKAT